MSWMRVRVHDPTRRSSLHAPKQLQHALSVGEIELRIDQEASARVDEPGARMPGRGLVGDAGIDVVAELL